MSRSVLIGALLLAMLAAVMWSLPSQQGDAALTQKLNVVGSSTVAPLVAEIAKRYEREHPGIQIDVQTGGSGRGITDARQGLADIGMVSRDLKASETDLHAHPVARDGIGIIVHADNPLTRLSRRQVVDIFTAEVTDWRDVGGAAAAITVVNKAEGRSTLELFLKFFGLKNSQVRPHVVIGDNEQGVKVVAGNPAAIGYVSIGTAEHDIALGVPIKLLALDGIVASRANVETGVYPLARTLNLITAEPASGLVLEFIDYARSESVHDIVVAQHFLPLAP